MIEFLNFIKSLVNLINFIKLKKKKEFVFFSSQILSRALYRFNFRIKKKNQNNIIIITMDEDDSKFYNKYIKTF